MRCIAQDSAKWITAYYPLWAAPSMYPESVDFSLVTHVVHFSANPVKKFPYLDVLVPVTPGKYNQDSVNIQWGGQYNGNNPPLWRKIDIQKTLITRAHERGVKVLLSVGGIYGVGRENMAWICRDDGRINTFISHACGYAKRKGYDGIELDWEHPYAEDRRGYCRLIMRFREELNQWSPKGVFVTAVNHTPWPNLGYDRDTMIAAFDQINAMTYEMYNGNYENIRTGYNTPIENSTEFPGSKGYALNQPGKGIKAWITYGIPASKLGLSISFLTTVFYKVSPPVQPGKEFRWHNWEYVKDIPKEGRHWDASSSVPWQASESTFITYEDTQSVRLKVEYAKGLGLAGIMIYDLLGGYVPGEQEQKKDVLLQEVRKAFLTNASGRPAKTDTMKPR